MLLDFSLYDLEKRDKLKKKAGRPKKDKRCNNGGHNEKYEKMTEAELNSVLDLLEAHIVSLQVTEAQMSKLFKSTSRYMIKTKRAIRALKHAHEDVNRFFIIEKERRERCWNPITKTFNIVNHY